MTSDDGRRSGRGPGRPAIGALLPPVAVGDELLIRLDVEARRTDKTRAATVRALLSEALDARERARRDTTQGQ